MRADFTMVGFTMEVWLSAERSLQFLYHFQGTHRLLNDNAMFEEKLVVRVASAGSIMAVAACLIVIPSLYNTINEIHDEVLE
ncbi:unnamed protein product, partial [Nippostrongylus brasiliensis]|uniref:Col_cuticle_N domain-containing protein n=1 Tax=Nippostrongylus brasiliensis TaxID=27835 RepID=A0A0N4Y0D8_NIPBR